MIQDEIYPGMLLRDKLPKIPDIVITSGYDKKIKRVTCKINPFRSENGGEYKLGTARATIFDNLFELESENFEDAKELFMRIKSGDTEDILIRKFP